MTVMTILIKPSEGLHHLTEINIEKLLKPNLKLEFISVTRYLQVVNRDPDI